jgi:hypothetical protein
LNNSFFAQGRLTGLYADDNDLFSLRGNVDVPVNGFSYFVVVAPPIKLLVTTLAVVVVVAVDVSVDASPSGRLSLLSLALKQKQK